MYTNRQIIKQKFNGESAGGVQKMMMALYHRKIPIVCFS